MLCSTANYKLRALRKISEHLTLKKAKLLYNAFIKSKFNYATVIWMLCRKKDYLKIEKKKKNYKAMHNGAMMCHFIKNTCMLWLQEYIKV